MDFVPDSSIHGTVRTTRFAFVTKHILTLLWWGSFFGDCFRLPKSSVVSQLTPWMPANIVSGEDRLKRSRMLMKQRPVVSRLNSWTWWH